ncbi:hypothetical protein [Ideonella sp.]|uniref:hypothetical protein n=1 Tax=Ideonella sp. TaxID=1929293 RepID=UPI002B49211B|nr:hypothetical protein [Ideonella sp.]HJV72019.1 hypothetical protein [Ideonella sp.]
MPAPLRRHVRACRRLAVTLGVLGGVGASAAAQAGECVNLRGGDLVLNASDACRAQIRRDPALRRRVVQTIDSQVVVASADTVPGASPGPGRDASERPAQPSRGLGHPLARMSMLNSQSRYLWSLGNPAPAYYGQTRP